MKLFFINIFFCILALLLVYKSPGEYSYDFCLLIACLFVIQNFIYFIFRNDSDIVCFEFFFMIAFGLTNFIYPIFYFPTNPDFSMFSLDFNYNVISKATSIALLGYTFFLTGLSFFDNKKSNTSNIKHSMNLEKTSLFLFKVTVIFFILYLISGGPKALASEYSNDGDQIAKGISPYFYMVFFSTSIIIAFLMFNNEIQKKYRLWFICLVVLIIFIFLGIGSRTLPLALALTAIVSYNNYKKKIPFITILILLLIGAVFLTLITFARSTSITDKGYVDQAMQNTQISSFWDFASDLVINNRNLYTLIDFADSQSYTYGLTMLAGIMSPIPFLQGFFCRTFNVPVDFIGSATFNTFLDLGTDSTWGLGSNLISDVYLAFGIIGVICFFYVLGMLLGKSKIEASKNIYWNIFYFFLVSNSVYWARSGFFDNLRYLVWALVIVSLYNIYLKRKTLIENK
jgi:oligosaccharide repeat unit polymerase